MTNRDKKENKNQADREIFLFIRILAGEKGEKKGKGSK